MIYQVAGVLRVARWWREGQAEPWELVDVVGWAEAPSAQQAQRLIRSDAMREGEYVLGDWVEVDVRRED